MSIWKKDQKKEEYKEIELLTDNFFEHLRGSKVLEYREGQHTMALDVIDAIKNKEILLIEAGVGIGKSYAYIIPILYAATKNKNFNGFIISTSTIALQEQIKKDIKTAAKMLNINIDVKIAKGKNNYICRKRLEFFLSTSVKTNQKYKYILEQLQDDNIEDRNNIDEIPKEIWEQIKITSCDEESCIMYFKCQYILNKKSWVNERHIICNHDLLIDSLRKVDNERIISDPSVLVIDEAHTLEQKIQNAYQESLNIRKILSLVYKIYEQLTNDQSFADFDNEIPDTLNLVFRKINRKARREFEDRRRKNIEYDETDKHGFKVTDSIEEVINQFLKQMTNLLKLRKQQAISHYLAIDINTLLYIMSIFEDIKKKDNSKNIYWIELDDTNTYQITFVPKNIKELTANLLSDPNYAKILTSATLTDNQNTYNYFSKNTGIDTITGIKVFKEFPIPSAYDYDKNTIAYIDNEAVSPRNPNHEKYLSSLANRIFELIDATDGKALVLFTSKKDMYDTYQRLIDRGIKHKIILQSENKSSENIKEEFSNNENSSLFATGTFWEGINIKGRSLSTIIITKLPFAVVNPITLEKEKTTTKPFVDIYLPDMIIKLKQGIGRLIRSTTDTGVIAILDSRVYEYNKKYNNIITKSIPTTNITSSMNKIRTFAIEKGIKEIKPSKRKNYK